MRWIRALGGLAVLLVIGLGLGAVASLAVSNDLLVSSAQQVPALVTIVVLAVGIGLTVLAARPSADWVTNPYW
jgi:uncharacterized membrane protein YczE